MKANVDKDVRASIAICKAILSKLDVYWLHAHCPVKWKIIVPDAVIRSKLLYGLETATLTEGTQHKLNTFQLKGLRKKNRMPPTYVNRANTNVKVIETANEILEDWAVRQGGNLKHVKKFGE